MEVYQIENITDIDILHIHCDRIAFVLGDSTVDSEMLLIVANLEIIDVQRLINISYFRWKYV